MILGILFILCFTVFPNYVFSGLCKDEREAGVGLISFLALCELIIEAFIVVTII